MIHWFCIFLLDLRKLKLWKFYYLEEKVSWISWKIRDMWLLQVSNTTNKWWSYIDLDALQLKLSSSTHSSSNQQMHLLKAKYLIIPSNSTYARSPMINSESPSLAIILFLNKLITCSYFSISIFRKHNFKNHLDYLKNVLPPSSKGGLIY